MITTGYWLCWLKGDLCRDVIYGSKVGDSIWNTSRQEEKGKSVRGVFYSEKRE